MVAINEQFKLEFRQWLRAMFDLHPVLNISMLGINADGKMSYNEQTHTINAPITVRESMTQFLMDEGLTVVVIHPLLLQISICS